MYNFQKVSLNNLVSADQVINLINKEMNNKIDSYKKAHLNLIKEMILEQCKVLEIKHPKKIVFYDFDLSRLNELPIERIHPLQFSQFTKDLSKQTSKIPARYKHSRDGRGRPRGNSDSFKSKLFNLLQEKYGSAPFATKDAVKSYQEIDDKKYNSITAMFAVYEKENRLQHVSRGFFQIID